MAFINEDKGLIFLGQLADLFQGGNVTIHRKGTISGYESQAMFLGKSVAGCKRLWIKTHPEQLGLVRGGGW